MTIDEVKANLGALLHGGDADDLDDVDLLLERSANKVLSKVDPLETIRTATLSQTIHDDVYNYAAPSDFKKLIDLIPQDNRQLWDKVVRNPAGQFDLLKAIQNKVISIEGSEGSKILRINWRTRKGKVLNSMDSLTGNGTWSAVGSATGVKVNTIFKKSGSGSVEFDLVSSGDGIKNTAQTALDLTDEDEVADIFVWLYLPSAPTSISARWGNDLTANYWSSTAQTAQADGTAFKTGWNLLKFSWASATETGTVVPTTVDSFQITVANSSAMVNIRVDNIIFSIGRNFDIKYYSKYLLKNTAGTWISRTTNDNDVVVLDNDGIEIYHRENLIAAGQQSQNSAYDFTWAGIELNGNTSAPHPADRIGLYGKYRGEHPSQSVKIVFNYGGKPGRGRW